MSHFFGSAQAKPAFHGCSVEPTNAVSVSMTYARCPLRMLQLEDSTNPCYAGFNPLGQLQLTLNPIHSTSQALSLSAIFALTHRKKGPRLVSRPVDQSPWDLKERNLKGLRRTPVRVCWAKRVKRRCLDLSWFAGPISIRGKHTRCRCHPSFWPGSFHV